MEMRDYPVQARKGLKRGSFSLVDLEPPFEQCHGHIIGHRGAFDSPEPPLVRCQGAFGFLVLVFGGEREKLGLDLRLTPF